MSGTVLSPNAIDTTVIQAGQGAGFVAIPAALKALNDSAAGMAINTQTGTTYTFATTDYGIMVQSNSASPAVFTVPLGLGVVGMKIYWRVIGVGALEIVGASGVTMLPGDIVTTAQYAEGYIHQIATNEWLVAGQNFTGAFEATITAITMNFTAFLGGSASGTTVGTITVSTTGLPFAGTLSLTGANASSFQISGSTLETNGTVANGSYSINIVATWAPASDSPFTQAFTITGSSQTTVPISTNYAPGGSSFQAYLANYTGQTTTQSLLVNNSTFPNNSVFTFTWAGSAQSVQGFSAIDYGNYTNTSVSVPITPSPIGEITALNATFNLGWTGNLPGFDIIFDFFLTSSAAAPGGSAPLECEVEVFLHTPSYAQSYINAGSLTQLGTTTISGVTWQVAHDPTGGASGSDYLFAPVGYGDVTVGSVNLLAMLQFLQTCAVPINSGWFYNGHDLGVEGANGAGVFTMGAYAVQYAFSTNLLVAPNDFSNAAWTKTGVTVANAGVANQALKETAVTSVHQVTQTVTLPATVVTYTFSVNAVAPATSGLTRAWLGVQMGANSFADGYTVNFDLATGTISSTNNYAFGAITLVGSTIVSQGGGIYTCAVQFTTSTSDTNAEFFVEIQSADGTSSYLGVVTDGIEITNANLQVT